MYRQWHQPQLWKDSTGGGVLSEDGRYSVNHTARVVHFTLSLLNRACCPTARQE